MITLFSGGRYLTTQAIDICPECGQEIKHEWEWELHKHNETPDLSRQDGESLTDYTLRWLQGRL